MSEYNAKNYTEQGGDTTHFGGKVIFEEGCEVEGLSGSGGSGEYTLPIASAETLGGVKVGAGLTITDGVLSADGITKAANQAALENNAELSDVVTAINTLLSALKTAGIMTADAASNP